MPEDKLELLLLDQLTKDKDGEALATTLGTPTEEPKWPFPTWRRLRPNLPELTEWRQFPELLRKVGLFKLPNAPTGERVKLTDPVLKDAVKTVYEKHPYAVRNTGSIRFEPLDKGTLGDFGWDDQVRVDPIQLTEPGALYPEGIQNLLVDVLRHELAHSTGHPDFERGQSPDELRKFNMELWNRSDIGPKFSAQHVDEASHREHHYKRSK